MLTDALDQLARWRVLLGKDFRISVNKSPDNYEAIYRGMGQTEFSAAAAHKNGKEASR